ncbi:leucine-rich repeat and guanylate kinase domain-containing protein [Zonotrichia leucophrys gambelii]|uniref:leucine-rich repeat and guanylate kinase domain-containing protein n=1 Tax=Zonotrichia leucophrys gambelii TaxID=257770 RepID=UPI0031400ACE
MAGGEENGTESSPGEPLPPPEEPPQALAEGLLQEKPRPGAPDGEDEQEEEGEEEESERSEGRSQEVLDEDTAAEGLQTFGRSAPGTEYVYLHLSLPGRGLRDVSILSGYVHLQKMELSSNKIHDLSCVSHMPYLVELNASNNELTTYFNFKAPKNLREVDFSHNQIPKMTDLSEYHSLTKLLLDYNEIEEIRGLERCHSLTQLGLSHNRLAAVRGLHNLPVRLLDLSFNQIEKVDGLKSLKKLQRVNLSNNKINSLQGLEEHELLEVINLEDNQVGSWCPLSTYLISKVVFSSLRPHFDELEEALTDLALIVKVYLGMEPPDVLENFEGFRGRTGSRTQLITEERAAPSYGDLLHISTHNYPRDLLDMLTATPGSVEEASLHRRFSAARQVLLSHRAMDPECEPSLQQLPRPVPPLPSGISGAHSQSSFMELGLAWRQVFVPPETALPGLEQLLWPKLPLPQRHLSAAGLGVHTWSAWNEPPESSEPEEEEAAGKGGAARKCSQANSGCSPGPHCPSRRLLPPITPRWASSTS